MEDKKLPVVNEYEHLGRRDVLKQWGPPALVGIATTLVYLFAYTPLKRRTPHNTAVGAISGALGFYFIWFPRNTVVAA